MMVDLEGIDGSGKKTQIELLKNTLEKAGKKVLVLSFPNYDSAASGAVKMYLNGELGDVNCLDAYQTSVLFAVDRLATMQQQDLSKYDYVLLDRYVPSNMIHQSTKCRDEELVKFLDWVSDFEYGKLKLPTPDVTIFLDMPVEKSLSLLHSRADNKHGGKTDVQENEQHLRLAYNRVKYVAHKYGWMHISCVKDNQIKSIREIHSEILEKLKIC